MRSASIRQTIVRLLVFLLAWSILPVAAAVAQPDAGGRRVALVIGNADYKAVSRLANPVNDARLIAQSLTAAGFTIVGGQAQIDLDKAGFDRAVQTFGNQLAGADVGLFYYSGHGLQVAGENWLVPIDANPGSVRDLDFQMVSAGLILKQLEASGTKLNMIILDACRNDPFGARGFRGAAGGLAEMHAPEGTLISYATQPGNVAADGAGKDSPYTTALAEAIAKPDLDVFQVFNRVGLDVKKQTGGTQQPWLASSPIAGDFVFTHAAATPTAAARPASSPPSGPAPAVDADALFWQSIASSSDPGDYAAYLHSFPNGRFAELARRRVETLGHAAAPAVGAERADTRPPAAAPATLGARPQVAMAPPALGEPPQPRNQGTGTPTPVNYADELTDFGVPPQPGLKRDVGSPTPLAIPRVRRVTTAEILAASQAGQRFGLIDAWQDPGHRTIPGALRLPFAGNYGTFQDGVQTALAGALARATSGNQDFPLVFFCESARCWESYNAALRAVAAGYRNVSWYRGGLRSWTTAGLPTN